MKAWIKVEGFIEVELKGRENMQDYLERVVTDEMFDVSEIKAFEARDIEYAYADKYTACSHCGCWYLSPWSSFDAHYIASCVQCEPHLGGRRKKGVSR